MKNGDLCTAIYEHLPGIDKILESEKLPIHQRIFGAAYLFVELAVDAPEPTKREMIGSPMFRETIVPIVSDWYWMEYGSLCRNQCEKELSGILSEHAQPLLIRFPQTLSRVETEGETAWLTFPDTLREEESIGEMTGDLLDVARMPSAVAKAVQSEAAMVVGHSRSINLNLMSKGSLDNETFSLAQTIWPHFEKAIRDLLALSQEGAAAACWDLHLAVEKSYKVLIRSKAGNPPHSHNLISLHQASIDCGAMIDVALMKRLPDEKSAIQFRYAEKLITPAEAICHYKTALTLVNQITSELPHTVRLNNTSLLIKVAPWAK
ncbi:MAG: hypothetical protein ABJQ29_14520 [Luteolibacter sp.]